MRSNLIFSRSLQVLLLLATCGVSGLTNAQGLTDILRSVTGAVAPQKQPEKQKGLTTTMGVRGMDDGEQVAKGPSSEDYALMESWAIDAKAAASAAKSRSLVARNVELKSDSSLAGGKK